MSLTARRIDTAEVAKLIRAALKRAFPGVKFSVKTSRYSGGSSIDIGWTDGPTARMVDAVTGRFQGGGFDGMIDLAYSVDHWMAKDGSITIARTSGTENSRGTVPAQDNPAHVVGAELVHFGSSYVHTRREASTALRNRALDKVRATLHLGDIDISDVRYVETVKTSGKHTWTAIELSRDVSVPAWNCYLSDLVHRDLVKRSAGVFPA